MSAIKCSKCEKDDNDERLLKFIHKGNEDYVCLHCLPYFIHG